MTKNNKIVLIILIIIGIILTPLKKIEAHTVDLDTESLITMPIMIIRGNGKVTIKNTVTNYTLYFQAIKIDNSTYSQINKTETEGKAQLEKIKEEYTALKKELDTLEETYNTSYNAYVEGQKNTSLGETEKEKLKTEYDTAKTNYQSKGTEYNSKVNEYNNKVKEIKDKIKELTPMYIESNWIKTDNNKITIDTTKFSGEQPYTIWVKLITANGTYYDEGIYTMSGTKKEQNSNNNEIENSNKVNNEIKNERYESDKKSNVTKNEVVESKTKNDGTTAQGKIPFTGTNKIILLGIALIIVSSVIFYNKYFKYKDIK